MTYSFWNQRNTKKIVDFTVVTISIFAATFSFLSYVKTETVEAKESQQAEAMNFNTGWNTTLNSVSTSIASNESNQEQLKLEYSYDNPYMDFPNLSKRYSENPDNTKKLVDRVADYIDKNRSRDNFDHSFESPVKSEVYVEVAIKYNVPIDQMLAVARSESRFGTDCYTASGNMNRICNYKNIFSIGLTESSSLGFKNWEDGVESFGRLYQSRKNRGFDDCAIWRIYNPNGDYCGKILNLAKKIDTYLNQ